ncbi:MAG TPA: metalloprotease, partial [Chryseobacterium sp.]
MINNFTFKIKNRNVQILFALCVLLPCSFFSQENKRLIKNYISTKHAQDFEKSDLIDFEIDNVDYSESLKGEIVKVQQKFKNLPVYNAVGTVLIKNGKIEYYSDSFIKNYDSSTSENVIITKEKALNNIALALKNNEIANFQILESTSPEFDQKNFVKQKLTFVEVNSNLKLAYEFSFQEPKSSNYWDILVD